MKQTQKSKLNWKPKPIMVMAQLTMRFFTIGKYFAKLVFCTVFAIFGESSDTEDQFTLLLRKV